MSSHGWYYWPWLQNNNGTNSVSLEVLSSVRKSDPVGVKAMPAGLLYVRRYYMLEVWSLDNIYQYKIKCRKNCVAKRFLSLSVIHYTEYGLLYPNNILNSFCTDILTC